jgi:hypothetical protein
LGGSQTNSCKIEDDQLQFTPVEYHQLMIEAREMAADKTPISSEYAAKIENLVFRTIALEGLVADKALHEAALRQTIEERKKERDAYRHTLEQIVHRLRKSNKAPVDFQKIETIALETLALPDQALQEARSYWENQIIKASEAVALDPDKPDWMYSPEFDEFLMSWLELKSFHESHEPSQVIGAKVISELIPFIRFLRRILVDREQTEETRRYAAEQLEALEGAVETTAWAAEG